MTESDRRHPRNPWLGLYFAALFIVAAVVGSIVLVDQFSRVVAGDIYGQRSEGFLLLGPAVFGVVGVITAVRGVRAFPPWLRYRATTEPVQRRVDKALDLDGQARWPLAVFGLLAVAGFVALLFAAPTGLAGEFLLVEFRVLAVLVFSACLGLLAQCLYFARSLP